MVPVTITLVIPGNLKYSVDLEYIRKWKSKLFNIVGIDRIDSLPNASGVPSGYSDSELTRVFTTSKRSEITLAIIGAQLELNFYARILPNGVVVLSLFEMGNILDRENQSIENFIVRCLYALTLTYVECGRSISLDRAIRLHHDETRGCLYDFNQNKIEIVHSLDKPKLCADCLARLGHAQVDAEFKPTLFRELKRIRKSLYYRILDWAKKNPIKTILLTTLWAILLHLTANFVYDFCKSEFGSIAESKTGASTPLNESSHKPPQTNEKSNH